MLLLLSCFVISCTKETRRLDSILDFSNVKVSSLGTNNVTIIEYISLRGNSERVAPTQGIAKCNIYGDKIFILDDINHQIHTYNKNGEFLFVVGETEENNNLLGAPIDFSVKDGLLYVYDSIGKSIFVFNSTTNQLINKIILPFHIRNFVKLKNDDFLCSVPKDQNRGEVVILNKEGHFQKCVIPFGNGYVDNYFRFAQFQVDIENNVIFYNHPKNNYIFQFDYNTGDLIKTYELTSLFGNLSTTPIFFDDKIVGVMYDENKFKFHFVLAKDIDHYKGYISKLVIGSFSPKLPTVLLCKNGDVFCSYFSSDLGVEKSLELKPYFNADGNSGFVLMLYKYNI